MHSALLASIALLAAAGDVDFDTGVVPILTKAGCNTAACHGAAAGRGGFKLSLYGGSPVADYDAIAREREGRRVNLAEPSRSLVLAKPTGELEHGGKVRLVSGEPAAETLENWIRQGARRSAVSPKLVRLEVRASSSFVECVPADIKLQATAVFAEGEPKDVTAQAVYTSEDDAAVTVSELGQVTIHRRGRHNILVRFLTEVVAVTVTAPSGEEPIDLTAQPRTGYIDDEIYSTLEELRIPPSPPADALALLRRLRLDLTGRLPTPKEIEDFELRIADSEQRDAEANSAIRIPQSAIESLVDDLLAGDDFNDYWAYRLGEWLRIGPAGSDEKAASIYHQWLRGQLAASEPLSEIAASLVTAGGDVYEHGPANFYRAAPDARGQAEHFSEVLMGVRLRCANCHNHPLDRWTQDDYHGLAAVFAGLERGRTIRYIGRGEVSHPATGEAAVPKLPGGKFLAADGDHRQALTNWLIANENPYFARSIVNRLWREMMGRGLVEPVDDFRATNPATHPALLDRLAEDFLKHNCDLRHTLKQFATSAAYARSSLPSAANEMDDRFYSHALRRPLSAEVLLDAIADVTGHRTVRDDEHARMIQLFGPAQANSELDVLGRCSREDSCSAGGAAGNVTRQLALLGGELLNRRIESPQGRLAATVGGEKSNAEIVHHFYLLALSRPPTEQEAAYWHEQLQASDEQARRMELQDFVWSLLNCDEFVRRY